MSNKQCNCGHCNCCNGYVQDAKNPNRYVNLETGKERSLDKKKWKLDWLIWWFVIAIVLTNYQPSGVTSKDRRPQGQGIQRSSK